MALLPLKREDLKPGTILKDALSNDRLHITAVGQFNTLAFWGNKGNKTENIFDLDYLIHSGDFTPVFVPCKTIPPAPSRQALKVFAYPGGACAWVVAGSEDDERLSHSKDLTHLYTFEDDDTLTIDQIH